jgi:uncharacterized metal-binding protein YceD (DUF177 family)
MEPIEDLIDATEAERSHLVPFLGIEALESFSFRYRLVPAAQGRFLLTGKIDAQVTQKCVVTLEPVLTHIDEDVSLECWPANQLEDQDEENANLAPDVLPDDPPVPIVDGRVDLGMLATELLASAIDPYPRKEGVAFDWKDPQGGSNATSASPFAELAKLKSKS